MEWIGRNQMNPRLESLHTSPPRATIDCSRLPKHGLTSLWLRLSTIPLFAYLSLPYNDKKIGRRHLVLIELKLKLHAALSSCLVWPLGAQVPPEEHSNNIVWYYSTEPFQFSRWKMNQGKEEQVEPRFLALPAPCYNASTLINSAQARAGESHAKQPLNKTIQCVNIYAWTGFRTTPMHGHG